MAAQMKLDWNYIEFRAAEVSSWRALKKAVDLGYHAGLLSDRAVYIIRTQRPFLFAYADGYSPVVYIGKGQAQKRITAHLKSWIPYLASKIPDLHVLIYYCEPKARWHGTNCEGVEADLIAKFIEAYGSRPLRNRNTPRDAYERTYASAELHVLHPGKGRGFHWALTPLPSSHFYRAGG
jgi:hypothetical protein